MTEFLHDALSQKANILTQNQSGAQGLGNFTVDNLDQMSKAQKIDLVYELLTQI